MWFSFPSSVLGSGTQQLNCHQLHSSIASAWYRKEIQSAVESDMAYMMLVSSREIRDLSAFGGCTCT